MSELARPADVQRLGEREVEHALTASAEECAALAARLGLVSLAALTARIRLKRTRGGTVVRLAGELTAEVVQACVVTLVPVAGTVAARFTVLYGSGTAALPTDIDHEAETAWEPLPDGPLDIGEVVAQELAMALDPYPRAPGAALDAAWSAEPAPEAKVNPFAALANLRKPRA